MRRLQPEIDLSLFSESFLMTNSKKYGRPMNQLGEKQGEKSAARGFLLVTFDSAVQVCFRKKDVTA